MIYNKYEYFKIIILIKLSHINVKKLIFIIKR